LACPSATFLDHRRAYQNAKVHTTRHLPRGRALPGAPWKQALGPQKLPRAGKSPGLALLARH